MGRLPDFNEDPGLRSATVVAPGSAQDPFTDPSATQQPPASAPSDPGAAPAGQPGEGAQTPATPTSASTDPAASAAPSAPPPAQTQPDSGQPLTLPTTEPPADSTAAPTAMSDEEYERLRQKVERDVEERWRNRQSGQDRQINEIRQELDRARADADEQRTLTRQTTLAGLPEEERARIQKQWELDDRERQLKEFSDSTLDLHSDVEVAMLLLEYNGVPGITEEVLQGVPQEERELFCMRQKLVYLEQGGSPSGASQTNGASRTAQPVATTPPAQPAPAGASAPSDVGGAGVPPATRPAKTGQSIDDMADNIANRGWQSTSFPRTRRG